MLGAKRIGHSDNGIDIFQSENKNVITIIKDDCFYHVTIENIMNGILNKQQEFKGLNRIELQKEFDKFIVVGKEKLSMMYTFEMRDKIIDAIMNKFETLNKLNLPDREKLIDIILQVAMKHHDDISKQDEDAACNAADIIIEQFGALKEKYNV